MNTRIKEVRKALNLTQAKLAEALRKTNNYIYLMEKGANPVTDNVIYDVCRIYNVNEAWLRTGKGEMFNPRTREQEIADITKSILKGEENGFIERVNKALLSLSAEQLDMVEELLNKIVTK